MRSATLVSTMVVALWAAGCAETLATIQTVHPPLGRRKIQTSQAAFQYSKGDVLELAGAQQWTLPGGEAVPDFEYLYIRVPRQAGTHRPGLQGVQFYRLVRVEKEEFLYRATSGSVRLRFGFLDRSHAHVEFDVETELLEPATAGPAAGGPAATETLSPAAAGRPVKTYRLTGKVSARENMELAQGLINRYREEVLRLEALAKPKVPAADEKTRP